MVTIGQGRSGFQQNILPSLADEATSNKVKQPVSTSNKNPIYGNWLFRLLKLPLCSWGSVSL